MITSTRNPHVKFALKLRDKRTRDAEGMFLIEGVRELGLALDADVAITQVFLEEKTHKNPTTQQIVRRLRKRVGVRLTEVDERVLNTLCYRGSTAKVLAIAKKYSTDLDILQTHPCPLYVICSGLEKPGNLGAVIRTADSVGVTGIIFTDVVTDIFNPNVIRASLGAVFSVSIATSNSEKVIKWLIDRQLQLIATTPDSKCMYVEVDYTRPTAIIIGSEADGLPDHWLECAHHRVALPQRGMVDSLNASVTATAVLFEAWRQRENR